MGASWSEQQPDVPGEIRRLQQMRRRVYLGSVFLVSLVSFEAVLCESALTVPLWFRVFNYVLTAYALGLLTYSTVWLWKSWAYNKQRRLLSMMDQLTGLMNWQGLLEVMRGYSAEESEQPVRLIYVDLVGLEKVNAVHGQTIGDSVLTNTARLLEENTPEDSHVGRLGGR